MYDAYSFLSSALVASASTIDAAGYEIVFAPEPASDGRRPTTYGEHQAKHAKLAGVEDKLTEVQLAELRKKLSMMSVTAVMDAYRSSYFQCKLEGDKVPSARAIQTLVQAWREMRRWSKRN